MLSVLKAARMSGVDAMPMDIWSRDANFDVLHVWGLDIAHYPVVNWARKSGKRVVMTALLPYLTAKRRLRHVASLLVGADRLRRDLLNMVDLLVVVNEAQAETACRMLGIQPENIAVIPNIIEGPYFERQTPASAASGPGDRYVLCAGNVCMRKNQLNLAKACLAVQCSLLLIGDVLPGEEGYGDAIARLIEGRASIRWLLGMPAASSHLVEAYQHCTAFALPSHEETQPISLLEAAAARKPLLIADRVYARQKYYRNARLVDPRSEKSIEQGLRSVLAEPTRYIPPMEFLEECHSEVVGAAYKRAYEMAHHMAD